MKPITLSVVTDAQTRSVTVRGIRGLNTDRIGLDAYVGTDLVRSRNYGGGARIHMGAELRLLDEVLVVVYASGFDGDADTAVLLEPCDDDDTLDMDAEPYMRVLGVAVTGARVLAYGDPDRDVLKYASERFSK